MAFGITSLTSSRRSVKADVVSGTTPTLSATKVMKSVNGTMMLLATGINDYQDCYECGYVTEGLQAVTYNLGKYYTSISVNSGTKIWTVDDIFGGDYSAMIVWEVKNISTDTTFKAYVRVGDRDDGVLVSSETVVYGAERTLDSFVGVSESFTGIIFSEGLDDFAGSEKALTFEYKALGESSGTDTDTFTLWTEDGAHRLTGIFTLDVEANTLSGSAGKIEDIGSDWYRVTINCSDMPVNTAEGADGTETIGQLFFNTVNRPIIVANAEFIDEDIHIGADTFTAETLKNSYFGETPATSGVALDQVIIFDVKFATSGNLDFYLNEYWNARFCGPFTLTSGGVLSGNGASSCEDIGDGWYRIKINLNNATKSGTEPAFLSNFYIQTSTTANGYLKYVGYEEPDIHEGAKEFTSSNGWKDGTVNYYFVSPENSKVIDPASDTIIFDVKFTSAGNFGFYLNEYYYGRYCGPFTLTSAGVLTGTGATLSNVGDGWYRITIDLSSSVKSATAPNFVSRINLSGTTANGYIKYMGLKPITVTVENGTGGGEYASGASATVVADSAGANQEFFGWRANGEIVSTNSSYTFTATEDITLTAVYATTYSSGTTYIDYTLENWAKDLKTFTFLFKKVTADATGSFKIRLCDSTKTALGYAITVTLTADSASASYGSVTTEDDWYRYSIVPTTLPKQAGKDGSETMKYIQIADVGTPITVADIDFLPTYIPKANDVFDLPETITGYNSSSNYITFKIKPVDPASSGTIQMKLSDGSSLSYGIRFTFVANNAPTVTGGSNRACASIEDIGGGWYLITTQTGAQISGSAFDATKIKFEAYSGFPAFYMKDLEIH